jgi:GxxExxY protein
MDVCDVVRETSYSIHQYLRSGASLRKLFGSSLEEASRRDPATYPIDVYDEDGTALGHFVADLLVEQQLIIELKACSPLLPEHTAQLFGYLRGCRLRHGLLINFGAATLQIKKFIL